MRVVIAWTTGGMFRTGKMNPDRMNVGRNVDRMASWKATCWVRVIVEMKRP